jgi:hypothetical protein
MTMGAFIGGLFLTILAACVGALVITGTVYVVKRAIYEIQLLDYKTKGYRKDK